MSHRHKHKVIKLKRHREKAGTAPGTITYLGNRKGSPSNIACITYSDTHYNKTVIDNPEDLNPEGLMEFRQWINIVGLSDEAFMARLGASTGLSNLVVEDIVNTDQRPKVDEFEHYIFGVFKMLYLDDQQQLVKEHIALILKKNQVYVYQEIQADVFERVRKRIADKSGRIRSRGSDYLFFALVDAIIDSYFTVLDHTEQNLDLLEEEIYSNPTHQTAYKIQQIRKEILNLRSWMGPVRDILSRLLQSDSHLISNDTKIFLRDALDHAQEVHETLQIQRELAFSLMEMYMSSMSNRMNEVMKVLTIMASIFIPLTFIAGVYGMNFKNMPELEWKYGYYISLGVMALVFISLILYFKKKRWF